ncbi:hypothetical protein [Brevibacterium paucivorans]|uniref:hypothetical protein n=1 Tax=Brevibacterium paucivorans TaxID=170994 RepID=UPI00321C293C
MMKTQNLITLLTAGCGASAVASAQTGSIGVAALATLATVCGLATTLVLTGQRK